MGGPFPLRRSTTQDFQYSSGFHHLRVRRIIMMPSVRIVVCAFLAFCFFNDVASYNPYAYRPSFFAPSINQDSYATMGDIDWSKRRSHNSYGGGSVSLMSPVWSFSSMADADWGWKKRKDESLEEDEEEDTATPLEDEIATSLDLKRSPLVYNWSSKYRRPYMLARRPGRTIYPYRAYARYGQAIPRPEGRQYSYASMADMDWGWKKRSQLPALMGASNDDADEEVLANALDKRNLASLAKNNFFPKHAYKRGIDADSNEDDIIEEEKRHVASLHRSGRSGEGPYSMRALRSGVSSLARNGALRGKRQ